MEKKSDLQIACDEAAASKFTYAYWRTDKPKQAGFSHELISCDSANLLDRTDLDTLDAFPFPGVDTGYKCIKRNVERIPNNDVLGTRAGDKYEWMTWREVDEQCEAFAHGVKFEGLAPEVEGEGKMWRFMGIQSKNRKEWQIVNLAGMYQNVTTVAFYDTLGVDATRFMCEQTELTTISMSADQVSKFIVTKKLDLASDKIQMEKVKNLIIYEDELDDKIVADAKEVDLKIYYMSKIIEAGKIAKAQGASDNQPKSDDVYMFSYTSGTTGDPKGVKLSHKMVIQAGAAVQSRMTVPMSEDDSYCSYLPASHSFEQAIFSVSLVFGMKCGFFAGDVQKLTEDLGVLKPTVFPSVPRLFNRIHDKIKAKFDAATGIGGWLARTALSSKMGYLKNGSGLKHSIYDRLIFKLPRESLGGQVRCMITGSAPIAGNVLDFLKVCFSCDICEGYGMTETCAGSVLTKEGDPQTGIVGGPLQNVKLMLKDIPEMNYKHTNEIPTGEVYFYGSSIMKGYYKNEEKTNECIFDGWLASGDVGAVLPNGALKIIDRAKNIFKLSQGEYIAPEKLENVFVQCSFGSQVWLYGESLRDYVIMFMVAEESVVKKWCTAKGLAGDWKDHVENPDLKQAICDELWSLADTNKFNPLERPKQFMLLADPFTIENEFLTPTMKMKRNVAKVKLAKEIELLYEMKPIIPTCRQKK